MKQELSASRLFTSVAVFTILQNEISSMTQQLPAILNGARGPASRERLGQMLTAA
jgi:hypothetical protein